MSDTQDTTEALPEPGADIPNFSVTDWGGAGTVDVVTFGEPKREIRFRQLDLADQWDIAELAGADPSPRWMGMTLIAASVMDIDGFPVRPIEQIDRKELRSRLKKIGADGMNAISAALEKKMRDTPPASSSADGAKN